MHELAEDLFPDDPEKQHKPDDYDGNGEMLWRTLLATFGGLALVAHQHKEKIICLVIALAVLGGGLLLASFK